MTLSEAAAILRNLYPDSNFVGAEKKAVISKEYGEYDDYSVYIQPGVDGSACQTSQGKTLEVALACAQKQWNSTPDTNRE